MTYAQAFTLSFGVSFVSGLIAYGLCIAHYYFTVERKLNNGK